MLILVFNYFCIVKKLIKILSIILLTTAYCYAIGAIYNSTIIREIQCNSTFEQVKNFSSVSQILFSNTSKSESLFNNNNQTPIQITSIHFYEFCLVIFVIGQLFEAKYYQYTCFSRNFLIKYRKNDNIFPFHYFW